MGEVFAGRYELVDLLGEGGMGSVWRAFDHRERCYIAIKVLRQSDATSLLRFVREQSFRIDHPHVVAPRSWAGEDERVLFTMDLIRGGSLATLLGDYGPLPPPWVAVLIDQVLSALTAVHRTGLVHRDIKPGNIMLEPTGRGRPIAKLTDFGVAVARHEPRLTRTSQVLGTPGYLAPEVIRGADPEPRHDIYAVGVLAAELLSGHRPAADADIPEVAPGGLPAALWTYARRLAARVPAERPTSCEQARAELATLGLLPAPDVVPDDGGEDIEVLDVVPELPPGWGPSGPIRWPGHGPEPVGQGPVAAPASPSDAAADVPAGPREPEHEPADAPVATAPPRAGETAAGPASEPTPEPPRANRRRWPLAVVSFLLVASGLALGAWALTAERPLSRPESGVDPTPDSGPGSAPAENTPVETAGERCGFTEVGRRAATAEGEALVCLQQSDATYRWTKRDQTKQERQ